MRIRTISEAFSMQPDQYVVKTEEEFENAKKFSPFTINHCIKEIKAEEVTVGTEYGHPVQTACYVGYNFDGKKLFHCIAKSMNVYYFPDAD